MDKSCHGEFTIINLSLSMNLTTWTANETFDQAISPQVIISLHFMVLQISIFQIFQWKILNLFHVASALRRAQWNKVLDTLSWKQRFSSFFYFIFRSCMLYWPILIRIGPQWQVSRNSPLLGPIWCKHEHHSTKFQNLCSITVHSILRNAQWTLYLSHSVKNEDIDIM